MGSRSTSSSPAVVQEEVRREKQGSPLPRGRRVTAKTSEIVKPDEGKWKEEEKADAEQEPSREEDAPALVAGRRGASRRTGPAPVVAVPAAEPESKAAAEKQTSPPPRARRATVKSTAAHRPADGVQEDLNWEANKEDAPVRGTVRRGTSRRARTAPVVAAPAAEENPPEPIKPDDSVEVEEEGMNQEKNNDVAPDKGVERRGPSRRSRHAPVVSKLAAKAAVEDGLLSPPPRGRRATVRVKSSEPPTIEGGEDDEKEEMQRDAVKENVPALAVGRRGGRWRARPEPVVPTPACDVAAEAVAPITSGRRGKAKALEPIRLNDGEEEDKAELMPEGKEEDAPAHGVARRGPTRRACPAPVEAPATRRSDAASVTEERDVPVEAVLVRPSRVRKPTMKAAADVKVPRRTTKKAAARQSTLQEEKQHDEPREAVPVTDEGCYDLGNVEESAAPHNLERSEFIDEPKQEDEDSLMNENEILTEETLAGEPPVNDEVLMEESLEEPPAIDQECTGNLTVEEEQSKDKSSVEEEQVDVDLCATLPSLADEPPVTDEVIMEDRLEELPAIDQECTGNLTVEEQQSKDKSPVEEQQVVVDLCTTLPSLEEAPHVIDQECTGNLTLEEQKSKDKSPVEEQQVDVNLCATLLSLEDSPVLGLASMLAEQAVEEDEGAHFQEGAGPSEEELDKGMYEENHHADEEIEMNACEELEIVQHSFQTDFDGEKAEMVTDKLPHSRASMDDDVEEDNFQGDDSVHVDEQKFVVDLEKAQLVSDKLPLSKATLDEDVEEDFQTDFFHVEQKEITTADSVQEVTKKMQQSTATMDEEGVSEDQLETDFVFAEQHKDPKLTGTDDEVHEEEKAIQIIEQMPQSIGSMNECVQEGVKIDFVHADELKNVVTADDMLEVTETEDKAVQRESAFAGDITSALLDGITEYLSIITITESTISRDKEVPMCKNNIEKNTDDLACKNKSENTDEPEQCKNKSENTAELVAMQENMGLKVAKKPADLNVLSLRKLRAKYKKKMERKEAKRVALAMVDENVCRSNATGQEQVRNLQQY